MAAQLSSNLGKIIGGFSDRQAGAGGAAGSILQQQLARTQGLFSPAASTGPDLTDPVALMARAQQSLSEGKRAEAMQWAQLSRQAQATEASTASQQQAATTASQRGVSFRQGQRDRLTTKGDANDKALGDIKTRESLMAAVEKTGNKALISAAAGMDNKSLSSALLSASKTSSGDDFLKGTPPIVADSAGNQWTAASRQGADGVIKTVYIPMTKGGAQPIEGERLHVVSRTTGVDAVGNLAVEAQGRWDVQREAISNKIIPMIETRIESNRALELLATTSTGGLNEQLTGLKNFFNLPGTASQAELSNTMGKYILSQVKKLGVNPTDTDLAFITSTGQNMGFSNTANIGLFQKSLKILNRAITANEFVLNNPSASRADYINEYKRLAEKSGDGRSETITVDFSNR